MSGISQEKAYIFRVTHIDNLPWIFSNGLHCRSSDVRDPGFHEIGNPELIDKRTRRIVPVEPGGTLSDYVPFYFTHYTPMLLNIKTGHNGMKQTAMSEIVILVSTLRHILEQGLRFVFTDRHAYTQTARYFTELHDLNAVDWQILAARDFRRDPDDPGKVERYMAEALVFRHVPLSALLGLVCHGTEQRDRLLAMQAEAGIALKTVVKPEWYF